MKSGSEQQHNFFTKHKVLQCDTKRPTKQSGFLTYHPLPFKFKPSAEDLQVEADYNIAMKVKKTGDIAKEARILQHIVDQYLDSEFTGLAVMDLGDLDFRLGQDKAAYGLMSSYNARWRTKWVPGHGGDAIRLTNDDCLLLTSLAVAKQGQVFAGQREYLLKYLGVPLSYDAEDFPNTDSPHDVAQFSYLALGWYWNEYKGNGEGINYRGDGLWYYQQAYDNGGRTAYLDSVLAQYASRAKNLPLELKYLDDAESRCRKSGSVQHEIKYLRYIYNEMTRQTHK